MIRTLLLVRNTRILFLYMFLLACSVILGGCRTEEDLSQEKEPPKEIREVVIKEKELPEPTPKDVPQQKEPIKQIPKAVVREKEPPPMIQIQNLSLTDKTMTLNYRLLNPFEDDIWVCFDKGVYGKQEVQHASMGIDSETVWIKLRCNFDNFTGFENPPSVAKYIRLKPSESCSGRIVRNLPIKDYMRERREYRKEHKEIDLPLTIFEVGYFEPKWNKFIDSLSKRSKKNTNKSNIRKVGPYYYIQPGPLITEETLDGQLREVIYLNDDFTGWIKNEVSSEIVITDVTIPCSVVVDDK